MLWATIHGENNPPLHASDPTSHPRNVRVFTCFTEGVQLGPI